MTSKKPQNMRVFNKFANITYRFNLKDLSNLRKQI